MQSIDCNPYQIVNDISHRTNRNNPKIYMESPKTPNSKNNLEKVQNWKYHAP